MKTLFSLLIATLLLSSCQMFEEPKPWILFTDQIPDELVDITGDYSEAYIDMDVLRTRDKYEVCDRVWNQTTWTYTETNCNDWYVFYAYTYYGKYDGTMYVSTTPIQTVGSEAMADLVQAKVKSAKEKDGIKFSLITLEDEDAENQFTKNWFGGGYFRIIKGIK